LVGEKRRRGLKPRLIFNGLRGPKGPLFHGSTDKSEFFSKLFSRPGMGLDVAAKLLMEDGCGMSLHASRHARKFSSLALGAMIENGCGTNNNWNAIKGDITQCLKQEDPILSKLTIPVTVFLRNTARGVCQVARQRLGLPTDANR
jgi:hypothetical protein